MGLIHKIPGSEAWEVIPALRKEEIQPRSGRIDLQELYGQARSCIDDHGGPDGIITHWDFPGPSLVSLLCRDYGLPGATPEAVAKCEHKYWMRLEQRKISSKQTPEIGAVNPFTPDEGKKRVPQYPFWLKPVKGHSSMLGFMVEDDDDLKEALHECRRKIHLLGEPFNEFLAQVGNTEDLDKIDGNYAIAESLISAKRQFTLEGYVWHGETVVYGAVDSIREGRYGSSFSRYQYPSSVPEAVLAKAKKITAAFLSHIGYDGSPFNVEFFWNPETDALNLLEINPRISKSHSPLFHMVDGASHHKIAIDLALGRKPKFPQRKGKDKLAAKFMLRSHEADGIIKRVPSEKEIDELKRILPDIDVNILVEKEDQLSALFYQDSYTYELVEVFIGGEDEEMLEDAYARCIDSLPIFIKPMPKAL